MLMAQIKVVYDGRNVNEIKELISTYKKAKLSYDNGKTLFEHRLFISSEEYGSVPCYFAKGKRSRGYAISLGTMLVFGSNRAVSNKSPEMKMREKCKKVISYLDKSGFWDSLKEACQCLIDASDEDLVRYLSYENRNGDCCSYDYEDTPKCVLSWKEPLRNLYYDSRALRTVNFGKYGNDRRRQVAEAVQNHKNLSLHWRESYDNSLSIQDGRAWYSEEYKGCGNGHYLFLLDEKHVLYGERD